MLGAILVTAGAAGLVGGLQLSSGVTISPPVAQPGTLSFTFDSQANQLLVVESATALTSGWSDAAYRLGTGAPIEFSTAIEEGARFFRVRSMPERPLALSPAEPTLAGGAVSLPDLTVGAAYQETIQPAWSGLPPYRIEVVGAAPTGLALTVVSNGTGQAAVAVGVADLGPTAGQRHQFSVTVVDSLDRTNRQQFDLRVIPPPPRIAVENLILKAGEPAQIALAAMDGSGPIAWSVAGGTLPGGLELSADGQLAGTPATEAAEFNEDGRYAVTLEVGDSLTDRVTGAPAPRYASQEVPVLVRLSYRLNIRATRENGPSLRQTCFVCHGPGFLPDLESESALALINVFSGSGAECGTDRPYVAPGDASDSLVYEKLLERSPCGERMPFAGPYLSEQRMARLARWIRELTPADTD